MEVLHDAFNGSGNPDVVGRFSRQRDVAHLEVGRPPRALRRKAGVTLFLFRQVAMKREFFRELALAASAMQ